jgi:hypothetical protein
MLIKIIKKIVKIYSTRIARRTIEKIKPVAYSYNSNTGFGYTAFKYPNNGSYNTAVGYHAYAVSGLHINKTNPNHNSIQFNTQNSKPVLVITQDGDVEWHGKPSEAASVLVNSFQMAVENSKGVTKAARRRYYMLACKNILSKAEEMEYEEFLAFLNKEVYNRENRVIMDSLKGES